MNVSTTGMHVVSEATIAIACFSAAFAVLWYILNRRSLNADYRRAGYLLFTCFLACGLSGWSISSPIILRKFRS